MALAALAPMYGKTEAHRRRRYLSSQLQLETKTSKRKPNDGRPRGLYPIIYKCKGWKWVVITPCKAECVASGVGLGVRFPSQEQFERPLWQQPRGLPALHNNHFT
jgi:hypothetical protein